MKQSYFSVSAIALALLVTACSDEGKTIAVNPNAKPPVSLGDLKSQVQSDKPPEDIVIDVDPAAKNINPLKTPENYLERDVFDALLIKAREDATYLDRSMSVTQDSLPGLPYTVSFEDYSKALEEAAIIHASSLNGDRAAHVALKQSRALLEPVLVMGERKDMEEQISPIEFKRRTTDFRKRTYLNYFLTVDKIRAEKSREEVKGLADALAETIPPEVLEDE